MTGLWDYGLYAMAFIAVVLAVEGVWRLVRSRLGEERAVNQRLARARHQASATAAGAREAVSSPVARLLAARLPWLDRAVSQAQAPFSASQVLLGTAVLFGLVLTGLHLIGAPRLLALAAALALGAAAPWLLLTNLAARRRRRFLEQLPQAVDLVARSLQAGHPVTTAMSVVGQRMPAPLGPEFRLVIEEMTYGLDRDEALDNLVRRFPVTELRMFVASLEVTRESGGNLAEVFLKLSGAIRAKDQLRRKVHAISAEGRMTFWVVSSLPFLVGGALMLIRPMFFLEVANDPLFWPMMSFPPVTLTIGAAIIWRMVNLKI